MPVFPGRQGCPALRFGGFCVRSRSMCYFQYKPKRAQVNGKLKERISEKNEKNAFRGLTNGEELAIIYRLIFVTELQPRRCREMEYLEWYRSGHNEHDWKSCDGQKPSEGSNPSHSAKAKILSTTVGRIFALYFSFLSLQYSLFISATGFSN